MYFPLRTATLLLGSSKMTFNEYRQQTVDAVLTGQPHLASSVGCSPGRTLEMPGSENLRMKISGQRQRLLARKAGARRLALGGANASSCAAMNELYCWMSCMDPRNLALGPKNPVSDLTTQCTLSNIVCANRTSGALYTGGMCPDCTLLCTASPPSPLPPPSPVSFPPPATKMKKSSPPPSKKKKTPPPPPSKKAGKN